MVTCLFKQYDPRAHHEPLHSTELQVQENGYLEEIRHAHYNASVSRDNERLVTQLI